MTNHKTRIVTHRSRNEEGANIKVGRGHHSTGKTKSGTKTGDKWRSRFVAVDPREMGRGRIRVNATFPHLPFHPPASAVRWH